MRTLIAATLISLSCIGAAQGANFSGNTGSFRVVDLTSRFLAFYEAAKTLRNGNERFAVWKDKYDFVALPPGLPDRDERARRMLADAWPRYADAIERIRSGPQELEPQGILEDVAALLEIRGEIPSISLLFYVGMFEGNAFFAPQPNDSLLVALPVEVPNLELEVSLAHELFHAVHHSLRDQGARREVSVASLVIDEGLAMWASRELFPGRPMSTYTRGRGEWSKLCRSRLDEILQGLKRDLRRNDQRFLNNLTVGHGVTGLKREAYCAGWHSVGALLADGYTFAEMARADAPDQLMEHAISLLGSSGSSAAQ